MELTERRTAATGGLLVIDLQERLLAIMRDRQPVVDAAILLIRAARLLGLPVWATEQYPKGLGPTVAEVAEIVQERSPKTTFHCCEVPGFLDDLRERGVRHLTLAGIEAHVCVAQTALELLALGFGVQVAADAVASRGPLDRDVALRRLERAGVVVTTAEAVVFEWAENADRPEFKELSSLIKARDNPRPFGFHP